MCDSYPFMSYQKQGFNASTAARSIYPGEGEHVVSKRTAQRWFEKFDSGGTDIGDKPRPGCPVTVDSEAIREAVEIELALSTANTLRLSADLN